MSATMLALTPRQDAEETVAKLEQACALLQEVRTIQEVKQIHDVAKAARVYAREHNLGRYAVLKAHGVICEALWRIGELLVQTKRAPGGRPYQRSTGSGSGPVATLEKLGISKKTSSYAQQLYFLPRDVFERIRDGETTLQIVLEQGKWERSAEMRAAWQEHLRRCNAIPEHEHLRVYPRAELFARGIEANAVITEPPASRDQLHVFSELALACVNVPIVIVAMNKGCLYLPEILQRLCAHLTYRQAYYCRWNWWTGPHDYRMVLLFAPGDEAIARAVTRQRQVHGPASWGAYCVQCFTDEGDVVVDPFMTNGATARAAVNYGRYFVGGSADVDAALADVRQRTEAERETFYDRVT